MTDTVDKIIIKSEVQGAQQTASDLKQVSGALDGVTVASDKVEKSTASIENRFATLERRLQTTAGQQSQYEKIQSQVNLAVQQNPALQDRANAVLQAAEARYLGAGRAVKDLAEAHKGLDAQGQAAFHSIRSVFEQIALGVPITQALTGQINHLTFAASGQGGLAGAFGQVGGIVRGLISPTTAVIGVTVAMGAAAAAAAVQYDRLQVSSQQAIGGAGARTGTTVSDLNAFTSQNASGFSGTGLSTREARTLGEDFTKTGDIVISRLHGMSDAVVGFSNQTGKSMSEASKAMVGFASDPKKALDDLSKVYGNFDIATRKAVDELVRADDKTGAFNVILDALAGKSKTAAENMQFYEKAVRAVSNALSTEVAKPVGLEGQLDAARARLSAAQAQSASADNPSVARGFAAQDIPKLTRDLEDLQKAMEAVNAQKAQAEINKLSTAADNADRGLIPEIAQIDQLKTKINELNAAKAAGVTSQYGAAVDADALVRANNLLKTTEDTKTANAGINAEVKRIGDQYQGVSSKASLILAAQKDQLAITKATTEAGKESATRAKDYNEAMLATGVATEATEIAMGKAAQRTAEAASHARNFYQAINQALLSTDRFNAGMSNFLPSNGVMPVSWGGSDVQASRYDGFNVPTGKQYTSGAAPGVTQINASGGGMLTSELERITSPSYLAAQLASKSISDSGSVVEAIKAVQQASILGGFPFGDTRVITPLDRDAAKTAQIQALIPNLTDSQRSELLAYEKSQPTSTITLNAITALTDALGTLTTSTGALNDTMQEALSPYYTQDPRTSHIGFRSQGMAAGGWVDVPGGVSSTDNMIATIPVASGERIYVDPMTSKRGGGSSPTTINISSPILIQGNANKDEVGRTVYQSMQRSARQLSAAGR
jgi:hypothetical protein